jgi:RNA polymerase sigma-70 factor (ECF subfamily)
MTNLKTKDVMTESLDEEIMISVAHGNQTALRRLVDRHLRRAHGIAFRVLGNKQDAEEAVQDAFCKIWVNAAGFDPGRAAFKTWFTRILTNTCLDKLRARMPAAANIDPLEDSLSDGAQVQDAEIIQGQESRRVKNAMQSLPDRQRMAVTLCYFEEMTNPEAASAMGLHLKALEGLLVRARKHLRTMLGDDHER